MELTRRDALAALAVVGAGAGGTSAFLAESQRDDGPPGAPSDGVEQPPASIDEHELETLIAVAEVVYPSAVTEVESFVRTFFRGRLADRPALVAGISAAVSRLDELGLDWHGAAAVDLDRETRERLLREVGADTAEAAPEGTPAERVRYFLVNELLFALYASPTGGELVGLENPQGHPGGLDSYRRGRGG